MKIYVGGKEATLTGATAGDAGAASLTVSAAVKDVSQGAVVCGAGAGKDGSAIYLTLVLGAGAYGVTTITGGGLEHIVKALGSGGTSHTACYALRALGAGDCIVVSRRGAVNYENVYSLHVDAEVIVNATPVGMFPNNGARPIDIRRFPRLCAVADVIYKKIPEILKNS